MVMFIVPSFEEIQYDCITFVVWTVKNEIIVYQSFVIVDQQFAIVIFNRHIDALKSLHFTFKLALSHLPEGIVCVWFHFRKLLPGKFQMQIENDNF